MTTKTYSITINLTEDEIKALHYYWTVSSDFNEVLYNTDIDLLDIVCNLAHTSLGVLDRKA